MRYPTLVILFFVAYTTVCIGQDRVRTVAMYQRKEIPRPFLVRWIKGLIGSSFGVVEKLQLKSDSTYYYSYQDRYCGTFNSEGTGTWKIADGLLILLPEGEFLLPSTTFIIERGKLYCSVDSLEGGLWAMKKRN